MYQAKFVSVPRPIWSRHGSRSSEGAGCGSDDSDEEFWVSCLVPIWCLHQKVDLSVVLFVSVVFRARALEYRAVLSWEVRNLRQAWSLKMRLGLPDESQIPSSHGSGIWCRKEDMTRATSHLVSFSRLNFSTRSLNREKSEMGEWLFFSFDWNVYQRQRFGVNLCEMQK